MSGQFLSTHRSRSMTIVGGGRGDTVVTIVLKDSASELFMFPIMKIE